MINEAFKSKILSKLASTIKEYEKEHHRNDIEKQKDYNDKGWGKINPSEKTFTSFFNSDNLVIISSNILSILIHLI